MSKLSGFGAKALFIYSLGTWINAAISFLAIPIMTRIYSPDVYGKIAIFVLITNIFFLIVLLGVDQAYMRFYHDMPDSDSKSNLFNSCLNISVAAWFIFAVILAMMKTRLSQALFGEKLSYVVLCIVVVVFVNIVLRYLNLNYRMSEKPVWFSAQLIAMNLVSNALGILAGLYEPIFENYIYAYTIGILSVMTVFSLIHRFLFKPFSVGIRIPEASEYLKYGIGFLPALLITWLNESVSKIMVQRYYGFHELGVFTSAFTLVAIMNLIQTGFITFWTPYFYSNYKDANNKFEIIARYITFAVIGMAIIIIALQDLVFLLLGPKYAGGREFFQFLLWIPVMYTLSEITVSGINLNKKIRYHILISGSVFIVNAGICLLLVPYMGAVGASIASAFAYLILFILRTIIGQSYFKTVKRYDMFAKSISIFAAVCILSYMTRNYILFRYTVCFSGLFALMLLFHVEFITLLKGLKFKFEKLN